VQEPIDPGDFADIETLQEHIFRRHEPAVLTWPEALEWPLRRWTPVDAADIAEFGFRESG